MCEVPRNITSTSTQNQVFKCSSCDTDGLKRNELHFFETYRRNYMA